MSNILQAILLGLLQGCSEFLPISSSAHLILLTKLMHWEDFGLPFDIIMHLGSLLSIIIYFISNKSFKQSLHAIGLDRLFLLLVIGTIPVGLCGLFFKHYIEHYSRSIELISITTMVFGILLGISYYIYLKRRIHNETFNSIFNSNPVKEYNLNINDSNYIINRNIFNKKFKFLSIKNIPIKFAILIGIAQAIAIIPGVSRSGITLTAALLLGFNLLSATRFSFLLAIPVILAAGLKQTLDLIYSSTIYINNLILLIGFLSSFASSLMFITLLFKYIEKIGMWPFVIYRILLAFIINSK